MRHKLSAAVGVLLVAGVAAAGWSVTRATAVTNSRPPAPAPLVISQATTATNSWPVTPPPPYNPYSDAARMGVKFPPVHPTLTPPPPPTPPGFVFPTGQPSRVAIVISGGPVGGGPLQHMPPPSTAGPPFPQPSGGPLFPPTS